MFAASEGRRKEPPLPVPYVNLRLLNCSLSPHLAYELQIYGEPLFLFLALGLGGLGGHVHDVLVQDQAIVLPLGQEVTGDLDGVLDVVNLADVEAVEACEETRKERGAIFVLYCTKAQ